MAQGLGYHRSNSAQEGPCRRTFWVLYYMEKTSCFATGKTSVSCVWPYSPTSSSKSGFNGLGSGRRQHKLCYPGYDRVHFS